ncbi:MAG: potassium transporter TrkA [Rhodospirillales bacterium RIFCSPLOWO2_12_FULL_58_28]|nr:MAG: potassium transporter TrkA [Rhodospirillales bacterium RIFCSPLOWO2_02_FULL_58_16]OHC78490.1 MAG: potassium transporter TrkA [Rhodospirillales bacterium RIFCSPLOWO2_12_FULL_58_28]
MHEITQAAAATDFQMWAVFAVILGALALYISERLPMEVSSFGVICALLLFFSVFPVADGKGGNLLGPADLLEGVANPALIAMLSLLVMGQGMVRTGVMDRSARLLMRICGHHAGVSITVSLIMVFAISAFINDTPVVIMFIPIMQALATRLGFSASRIMLPLSYVALLGGMTTLVGTSTNLLVNSALIQMSVRPFGFFDFTIPSLAVGGAGLLFILLFASRLLPDRTSLVNTMFEGGGKQFIAQIIITEGSQLVGKEAAGGHFASLPDMTVRMVQRGEEGILPPFENYQAQAGDVLVVAATRKVLTMALSHDPGLLDPDIDDDRIPDGERSQRNSQRMLAEVMVAPASRFIGQTLPQIGFHYKTQCIVLGIQRRSRMIRSRLADIQLRAGDMLLVQGQPKNISALKRQGDVVLIEWSTEELPTLDHAKRASLIFLITILLSASELLPVVAATLTGATAMVALGVLNVRQAARAIDPMLVSMILASMAMGAALHGTGGAAYLANAFVKAFEGFGPTVILSLFFLMVVGFTNVLANNAVAVLLTPIAVNLAQAMSLPHEPFAVAVIIGASCSFSPIGYQTNLLVMAPGHYKFTDYARVGIPLAIVMWTVFTMFVPWYYGL